MTNRLGESEFDGSLLPRRTVLGLLGAASVAGFAAPAGARPQREINPIDVAPYSVVNGEGESPINTTLGLDDRIYDAYTGGTDPVLAPDGHHVTWGEFSDVGGSVRLKCLRRGTHVTVHAEGLLPRGLYTIWVAILLNDLETVVGAAPLGPNDGTKSGFRASGSGRGTIVGIDLSAPLTFDQNPAFDGYETPDCLLDVQRRFVVEIAAAYHYDDETHGPVRGPKSVEQASTLFGL